MGETPKTALAHLFPKPNSEFKMHKASSIGTGLGLAIARQIIEETHSDKLSCNSILGKSIEFIIKIPV